MSETSTLVTFLGKGQDNKRTGYRPATYCFPDNSEKETPFFGLALADYLDADRLVILGTSGSQWGVLVENLAERGEEERILNLIEAEIANTVDQGMLDDLADVMSRATGRTVLPRLIPFGKNKEEQYRILDTVAASVSNGTVNFDVTHGFRHLGMVGFLSAFMLERVRNLQVAHLWYGALDMTDSGKTPVLKLDALTRVQRWVDALNRFDAIGDYGVFAPLLIEDGVPPDRARCLEMAAFFERTSNDRDTKRKLDTFLPVLNKPLTGVSGLFQNTLKGRLEWVKEQGRATRQYKLALQHLERADFVRAAIFGLEAFITQECSNRNRDPDKRKDREEVTKELSTAGQLSGDKYEAYQTLNALRNTMVHGTRPKKLYALESHLGDCKKLRAVMKRKLTRLLD